MDFPIAFILAVALITGLGVELFFRRRAAWAIPTAIIYATVFAWYFVDYLGYPERYEGMPGLFVASSFWQVAVFLVSFRLLVPKIARRFCRNVSGSVDQGRSRLSDQALLLGAVVLWIILLTIGLWRMDWDVVASLFPMDARAGSKMWDRAAAGDAGPTGFLVSTAGYLYLLVCAFFGVLFILERKIFLRLICLGLIGLTWPYFLLYGLRNQFLAVIMPTAFAYVLFSRQKWLLKAVLLAICFLALDSAFRIVVNYRNVGFRAFLDPEQREEIDESELEHEGLNMFQELCFINLYSYTGDMKMTLGKEYLANALNFVPRIIWPGKPLVGVDYSKWRGFEGGDSDIGVAATVSTGLIGQGILEFGPYLGPITPALLMALWAGLLARWWSQRTSRLRLILFLLGVGVTFNLGRNITLFSLWPIVFAYLIVRFVEKLSVPARPSRLPIPVAREAIRS
jgi:hypothetical protein